MEFERYEVNGTMAIIRAEGYMPTNIAVPFTKPPATVLFEGFPDRMRLTNGGVARCQRMTRVGGLTDGAAIALARKAANYLAAFRWCGGVKESLLAFDLGYRLGIELLDC